MLIPLAVLAVGALFAGAVFAPYFIGERYDAFWKGALFLGPHNHILHEMHEIPHYVPIIPTVMMAAGFVVALFMYVIAPSTPRRLADAMPALYRFLLNKWYFDELYDYLFVRPAYGFGRLFWKGGDVGIIDRLGPDGVAARVVDATGRVVKLQSGYIYHYAFAMMIGLAAIISWYLVGSVR